MYQKPDFLYDKDNKDSTFVSKIERDSNICNSCYRKVREHFPTINDLASPVTEYDNNVEFGYFDDFEESGRPNAHKPYCQCGAVDWQDARIRPIDEDEMEEIAHRLSKHLEEKGITHNENELVSYILDKYNLPYYQDREELIFEEAVAYSIEEIKTESADEDIVID